MTIRGVAHVRQTLVEKVLHVLVVQPIVNVAAIATGTQQTLPSHIAQLMRYGGLAQPQRFGEMIDAQLTVRQGGNDAQTGRVAERLEDAR